MDILNILALCVAFCGFCLMLQMVIHDIIKWKQYESYKDQHNKK